ncbi:hypothetical protein [Nonomuraea sp. NPDC049129]|uniref:hypothetical protein n=1 Tax=Nonomuraea sp. NPDC049129 TaxID=3155272 RepID=UPI0033D113C0
MRTFDHDEEQFIHLMRLTWDLAQLGVALAMQWPRRHEPFISIPRARGALRVRAALRGEDWVFTWGHGQGRWVAAYDEDAVARVWEEAQ